MFLKGDDTAQTVEACRALADGGLIPVPHIAARSMTSKDAVAGYLRRLTEEGGVTRVLLIGGDLETPRGPFPDALALLRTDLLQQHGIASVAFAGHPEGHPRVAGKVMDQALVEKCAYAERAGLSSNIITQLCFEAAPILDWVRRVRLAGVTAPVSFGAAAPTDPLRLARFGLRFGLGASMRALVNRGDTLKAAIARQGPQTLIADLAEALARDQGGRIGKTAAMHFFVFDSAVNAADWLAAEKARERIT
jgi:methylenetetrahydrofolate reductase (NADPH)